jgi:ribosome recycling factor
MSVLDIVYSEIARIRDKIRDKIEQEESSKTLVKDTLYGFYQEYESYSQRANSPLNSEIDEMLKGYQTLFKDISVKLRDLLPEGLVTKIKNLTGMIGNILTSIRSIETDLLSSVKVCADEALDIYNNFDNYFR